jgi:hypothetical protein
MKAKVVLIGKKTKCQFSQSANFRQKEWDGRAMSGQPLKGCMCRTSIVFP